MMIALIGFNANAAIYIVGDSPFAGWHTYNGTEMTDNGDGTYSYKATISGSVSRSVLICSVRDRA